jgi:hypothetical protein
MDGERGIFDCVLVCEFSDLKNMKNETLPYLYFCNFLRMAWLDRVEYLRA